MKIEVFSGDVKVFSPFSILVTFNCLEDVQAWIEGTEENSNIKYNSVTASGSYSYPQNEITQTIKRHLGDY